MYELIKNLFIFDVSYGQEVFIPEQLSQKDYPLSCKFYDPIISIIKDGIPDDRKQYFFFNNKDRIAEYKKYNFLEQLADRWIY